MPQIILDRPPRIQPELPQGEFEIPNPPQKEAGRGTLQHLILPFITITGYILISLTGAGRSPMLLIPMGLSAVVSTFFALRNIRRQRADSRALEAAYEQRLADLRHQMESGQQAQRTFYWYNYPAPETLLDLASGEAGSRSGSRLWERRPGDLDFGALRIGVGRRPSTLVYRLGKGENREDPQMQAAERLARDSRVLDDVPITIPLRNASGHKQEDGNLLAEARHALGIAGPNSATSADFARALAAHLCAFHSPLDLRLFVVGAPAARARWEWAMWLPHCNGRAESYLGDQMCFEAQAIPAFWDNLAEELDKRQLRLQDERGVDVTLPFLVVVIDRLDLLDPDSPLQEVEAEAAVSMLLKQGPQLGAAVLFLTPEAAKIPGDCQALIEVEPAGDEVVFRYAEVGLNTPRYLGSADTLDSARAEKRFAFLMRDLGLRRGYGEDLTSHITLLELLGKDRVEDLPIAANWERSRAPEGAEWLRAPLGEVGAGKTGGLAFSADEDGVHGMIAGTTGSGKSELLLTLIAALAVQYDPSILNFVLVDYKGGAAFEPFRKLPHVVDIATNLEGNAVERMFIAIKAELDRRGEILKNYNVKHCVEYRRKGYHLQRPFPHLFIIVDEFAEMVAENAEYKARFDSITRLGRAIGVSLILATQRPTGAVTDQMRANMKFRICLRVETSEDSRELLRRSDAAYLPSNVPGRAYVQVGSDQLSLMQVARAGGPYSHEKPVVLDDFIWLDDVEAAQVGAADTTPQGAETEASHPLNPASDSLPQEISEALGGASPETMIDWIVGYTALMAQRLAVAPQSKPWPDPLPLRLPLNLPLETTHLNTARAAPDSLVLSEALAGWVRGQGTWAAIDWRLDPLKVDIGLVDNPHMSERRLLSVDLRRGPLVMFGAPGWGKSTFLRTLMLTLAARHSPDELQIYALDFGRGGLSSLQALPHLGASIDSSEPARVERLMRMLVNMLESRRSRVMQYGSLVAYNAENPQARLPAVLVVADNFAEFKENYENHIPTLLSLVRDGRAFGLYFVVTASQVSDLPGKLYNLFAERMTLKLPDVTEYSAIVGRGAPRFNDVAGRGVVSIQRRPMEFQIAIPMTEHEPAAEALLDEGGLYEDLSQAMSSAWQGERPDPVEILPETIRLHALLEKPTVHTPGCLGILGLNDLDRKPTAVDLARFGPHFLVVGPPLSGKTNALRVWALSLALRYPPEELGLLLFDPKQSLYDYGGRRALSDLPQVLAAVSEPAVLENALRQLALEYSAAPTGDGNKPSAVRHLVVLIDHYDDFGDMSSRAEVLYLAELARRHASQGLHVVLGGSNQILRGRDELVRQVEAARYSLVLQDAELARSLGGKLPYGSVKVDYPPGRGFVVKSGRSALTQIALPFDPFEEQMERDLDSWVDRICDLYPEQRARWQTRSEPEMQRPEATIRTGAAPDVDMSLLIEGMEMSPELEQELRRQMKEMGLEPPESFGG